MLYQGEVGYYFMKRIFIVLVVLFISSQAVAQNYQLHAVYMYQFIKYIKWPEGAASGDFVIGVLGESPATEHLQKMADTKKAGSRNIVLKKFNSPSEVTDTHMLFIGKGTVENVAAVLEYTQNTNTLLVTEEEGFGLEGSNINFVLRNGRLVFELNQSAMDRESLKVSTELAKLAIVI